VTEADIAIRFGRPQDGDVIANPLVTIGFGFYAMADRRRQIKSGMEPVFVGFDETNAYLLEALWLSRQFPAARMSIRTSNQLAQAVAARAGAGAGIALLPHLVGKAAKGLQACHLDHIPPAREL
jgi:DNA-binding transcriptional LysR family regulator